MKGIISKIAFCILLVVTLKITANAENWPQWRGPFLNGSTTETGLPTTFSETENVLWKTPLPGGSGATPVIWNKHIFVSSTDEQTKKLTAMCFDAATGKLLWQKDMGDDRTVPRNNMASPSPVTDGNLVYFFFGTGRLSAFDFNGSEKWTRDLEADHGHNALMFGYSSSPLLYKGKLYILAIRNKKQNRYGKSTDADSDSYLLAIDKDSGKDIWKCIRNTDAIDEAQEAYSSAMPFESGDRYEILVFGADYLTGHDQATGTELWRWAGYNTKHIQHWRIIPSPVVSGDTVIIPGPKHSTMFAVKPDKSGLLGETNVTWTFDNFIPDASTPLLYNGQLYVLDDDRKVMTCIDPASGEKKWEIKIESKHVMRPSPLGADGRIYCMNDIGEVTVITTGEKPEIIHRTSLGTGKKDCRSSIVAAGGHLYVRTSEALYCFALQHGQGK